MVLFKLIFNFDIIKLAQVPVVDFVLSDGRLIRHDWSYFIARLL